ncbi:MAG: bifunctional glutamate N-acetyltransferase/amino-acid acetyltransferase ArgJ [Solirubrobacterales bacterium]|nr:bifunctional glutamate N-acetyltransferase/amino-acid acetyltransferase ArgJ [Solirubrobacterales bacterium]
MSFFSSRWVDVPESLTEVPGGGLPQGFRAAGVACGLKADGGADLGLIVSDAPQTTSAARFTRSGVLAAPVLVTKERTRLDAIRVVAANSGNANAATGNRGLDEAARMQGAAAMAGRVESDQVAVCSTGVIGVQLDGRKVVRGVLAASSELGSDDAAFSAAIMTTDAFEKRVALELELSGGLVRISAQAKGAGMIQPAFATMLCFVQTDAALEAATADLLLGVCVKRSFDRISVDGQLSTNDTVILQASGASGVAVAPQSADEIAFGQALDALLRQLALLIVKDGEGAARVGRVVVTGGDARGVPAVARAIANSPLVKTALNGADPNWGRIAQSIGMALPYSSPLLFDIAIEGVPVAVGGQAAEHDTAALAEAVTRDEVEYAVELPGEGVEEEVFFSDLGHSYVTINAEYTT